MEEKINVVPAVGSVTHISWGSIFAGTIIALVVQFTLIMLGFAIGFGTLAAADGNVLGGIGIGAAVWWILSSIVALFAGGWVSSRLAGMQRTFDGLLHGLVTWGLVTLVTVYMFTSGIGAVLGGAFGVVRGALTLTAQGASSVLPEIMGQVTGGQGISALEEEIRQAIGGGGAGSQTVITEVRSNVQKMLQGTYTSADRQRMVGIIVNNSDMNRTQAQELVMRIESTVQQAPGQLQQAQQTAQEVAAGATRVLTAAAVASFIMLILTAAAAGLGGWVGRVRGIVEV